MSFLSSSYRDYPTKMGRSGQHTIRIKLKSIAIFYLEFLLGLPLFYSQV